MGPRYRFLVTPLRRSPSPPSHILLVLARVSSCCLQFLNPFRSRQRFLAAEVAAGPTGQAGPGGSSQSTGEFRMGEQTGASLLASGWSEPGPAPAPARVLPSPAPSPDRWLCGATGALAVHLLAHSEGSQVPRASILLPRALAAETESRGGNKPDAYSPPLLRPEPLHRAMPLRGCLRELLLQKAAPAGLCR